MCPGSSEDLLSIWETASTPVTAPEGASPVHTWILDFWPRDGETLVSAVCTFRRGVLFCSSPEEYSRVVGVQSFAGFENSTSG